jgi:hypothetical protein
MLLTLGLASYSISISVKPVWIEPETVNLLPDTSEQSKSGGDDGIQKSGYEGSQLLEPELDTGSHYLGGPIRFKPPNLRSYT